MRAEARAASHLPQALLLTALLLLGATAAVGPALAQEGDTSDGEQTLRNLATRSAESAGNAILASLEEADGAKTPLASLSVDADWLADAAARDTRSAGDQELRGALAREVGSLHRDTIVLDASWTSWAAQRNRLDEPDAVQTATEALTTAQLTLTAARSRAAAFDELGVPHANLDRALDEYAAAVDEAWRILGALRAETAAPVLRIYLDPPAPVLYDEVHLEGLASNFRTPPVVDVVVDGQVVASLRARGSGSFNGTLPDRVVTVGDHVLVVRAVSDNATISSPPLAFKVAKLPITLGLALLTPETPAGENASIRLLAISARGESLSREARIAFEGRVISLTTTRDGLGGFTMVRPAEGGRSVVVATMEGNDTLASGRAVLALLGPTAPQEISVGSSTLALGISVVLTLAHVATAYLLYPRVRLARFLPFVAAPVAALPVLLGVSARAAIVALLANLVLGGAIILLRRPVADAPSFPRLAERPSPTVAAAAPLPTAGIDEDEIVRRYHELLAALHARGVDVRTLTPREIAVEMTARGAPLTDVDTVTRVVEAHLYREDRQQGEAARRFEEAARRLQGAA